MKSLYLRELWLGEPADHDDCPSNSLECERRDPSEMKEYNIYCEREARRADDELIVGENDLIISTQSTQL